MDTGADFPTDTQSAEPAQKCEGRFDDPAVLAQTASVLGAAPGDERADARLTDLAAVDVVVVTAVGVEDVRAMPGSSALVAALFLIGDPYPGYVHTGGVGVYLPVGPRPSP